MDKDAIKRLHDYLSMMQAACPQGHMLVTLTAAQLEFLVDAVEIAGEL